MIDVAAPAIEVFREPASNGYRDVQRLDSGRIQIQAFPDAEFNVSDLLGW